MYLGGFVAKHKRPVDTLFKQLWMKKRVIYKIFLSVTGNGLPHSLCKSAGNTL
jgi:hypothetical protein